MWELVIAAVFSTVEIIGALFFPTLVGIGIVSHGLFDFVHDGIVQNAGVRSGCQASVEASMWCWASG
jgi:hypothetical protein